MKTCKVCRQDKPKESFPKSNSNIDGRRGYCRDCANEKRRSRPSRWKSLTKEEKAKQRARLNEWRRKNRTHSRARSYARRLRKIFGLTMEQYNEMLKAQGGACAICHRPPGKICLNVDHDHSTGKIRGLLCVPCNLMIGNAGDQESTLQSGIDYLRRAKVKLFSILKENRS